MLHCWNELSSLTYSSDQSVVVRLEQVIMDSLTVALWKWLIDDVFLLYFPAESMFFYAVPRAKHFIINS